MTKTTHLKLFFISLSIFIGFQSWAQISGVSPNAGNRGQTLPIIISGSSGNFTSQGSGTQFLLAQGSYVIGPGSSAMQGTAIGLFSNVQIVNTSEIHGDMSIPMNAPLGQYYVQAWSQNSTYSLQSAFTVLQGTTTGVSMKTGGGKPGTIVNEEFTWQNIDLTGQTISHMWLSKNNTTINSLTNPTVVQKNTDVTVTIQIPANAEIGYWKVNMQTSTGDVYESPEAFLIDAEFSMPNLIDELPIQVYPNPFENDLTLQLPELKNGSVRVLDLKGQFLKFQNIELSTKVLRLNMEDVNPGIYLVQVLNNNTVITSIKMIKN